MVIRTVEEYKESSRESAFHEVATMHAEGFMAAQKMMILAEYPFNQYGARAMAAAGITPWDKRFEK